MIEPLESDFSMGPVRIECTLVPGARWFKLYVSGENGRENASFQFTKEFPVPIKAAEFLESNANTLALAFATSSSLSVSRGIADALTRFATEVIRRGSPERHRQRMVASAPKILGYASRQLAFQ